MHVRTQRTDRIELDALVFAWPENLQDLKAPEFLVNAFAAPGTSLEDVVARFLERVCPDGVPGTLIVSNAAHEVDRPSWDRQLLFRPVCEGPLAEELGRNGYTLGLRVFRHQGRLAISRLEVTPHVPKRDFEVEVTGVIHWLSSSDFMSAEDFDRLAHLPERRAETRKRLTSWRTYLAWREKLIHDNQVSIPFVAFRWTSDDRIVFLVDEPLPTNRKLVGLEIGFTEATEASEARPPKLTKLGTIRSMDEVGRGSKSAPNAWTPSGTEPVAGQTCVVVQVEDDVAALHAREIPARGLLMSTISGDLAPLHNQSVGMDRLQRDQSFSPRLGDFLFSASGASVPASLPEGLPHVEGGRDLNEGQQEAVIKALAAPDLCLIQGPPGTGKTTVIAEICLRTALAGQRVLIASQTNLAVDNALARLADQPAVRRLRLGDPDRVDEEFKDFLATHVIEHWFRAVAENCGKQQDATEAAMKDARHRSDAVDRMDGIALACAERTQQLARAATKCSQLRPELDAVGDARQAAAARRDASRDRLALWRELELWATIAGSLPTRLASLGQAIDIDELGQMDRDSERLPQIEGLLDALESVRRVGDGGEGNEELRQLRRRKQELDDAETDAELRELGEVNKRIKGLQGEGWSKATGALSRAAKAVYGPSLTPEIGRIVDALQRGSETAEALADAIKAARALRQAAERARHKRERFAKRCVQMTASTADQIESEERALEDADAMEKRTREALEQARLDREELGRSLDALSAEWKELWTMFAPGERAPAPTTKAAAEARHRFEAEEAEKAAERRRAERWSPIQHEWRARLAKISDSDREQIEGLYVRHANVVGMTTNEAGKKQTWQNDNFRPFDVVIIDEVSKATPPELLLPMLLGEKVILVGDHRQLPPMFRERDASFGEAGAEGEVSQDDISKYRRMVTASLFEELFDQADDRIKATLWTQYRMHPDIMTAVNQFYDGRLEAGPDELTLSARRRHHLRIPDRTGGVLLDEGQHLLWIDSSTDAAGRRSFEEQSGTSKVNDLEVKLVVETVLSLGRALAERGFRGDREVLVSPDHAGAPLREVIARLCPDLPNETIDELFEERRVRVGGRSRPPQEPARSGETILLQARREVGVISFYGAQLKALRDELTEARRLAPDAFVGIDLRTNTVDRFQGMEKSIIVASLVRSTKGHLGEFVREYQRINVGLSRAQRLLVIVGAIDTWKHAQVPLPPIAGGPAEDKPVYANILDHVRIRGGRRTARQLLAS